MPKTCRIFQSYHTQQGNRLPRVPLPLLRAEKHVRVDVLLVSAEGHVAVCGLSCLALPEQKKEQKSDETTNLLLLSTEGVWDFSLQRACKKFRRELTRNPVDSPRSVRQIERSRQIIRELYPEL